MNNSIKDIQIRDIKPPVEISDWSEYLLWGLATLLVIALIAGVWFLIRYIRANKKVDKRKLWLEELYKIDWSNPKDTAYRITKYGRLLSEDDERRERMYEHLLPLLEKYKYRKVVDSADDEVKREFEIFRRVCDESI